MTSDGSGASTSREATPTPRYAESVDEVQCDMSIAQPSQEINFYDARSPLNAKSSHFAPQFSSAVIDTGTETEPMAGVSTEDASIYGLNPDELSAPHPSGCPLDSSKPPARFSPQLATPPHQSTSRTSEDVPPGIEFPGQTDFRTPAHHHPYTQRPGYIGQYSLPVQHIGAPGPHPTPPQYAYHGYHPSHHTQTYSYQNHTPENSSLVPSPFSPSPIYAQQGMSSQTLTNRGTPPFVGGSYTSLQYPSPEFAYRPPNFFPVMYQTAQYALPHYAPHFSSPPEGDRRAEWWYTQAGNPEAPQQRYDAGRPPLPAFQRHYSYPYSSSGTNINLNPTQLPSHTSRTRFPSSTHAAPSVNHDPSSIHSSNTPGIAPPQSDANSSDEKLTAERPLIRRPYHPKPPPQRSEWTMWAGNVPFDATHDEAWRFFKQLPSRESSKPEPSPVVSVFLINRSNCAFINYDTEGHLKEAIEHFNGKQLRPEDPRCLKLVCRVRKKDDDLKAGVGAQRGTGMHLSWIKEQKAKRASSPLQDRGEEPLVRMASSLSLSSSDDRRQPQAESSTSSYSSTSSSILARYFPKRYFILKSLTQHDLDLSLEKGLWATQKHNEGVLDKAYRTSEEVFLIFGVNKSGEFYGYARMAGPVQSGEQQVAWEARKVDSPSSASRSSTSDEPHSILSPEDTREVVESPLPHEDVGDIPMPPVSEEPDVMGTEVLHTQTAPAELGPEHQRMSVEVPQTHFTCDGPQQRFIESNVVPEEPDDSKGPDNEGGEDDNSWGESFKVEWLCTERLPFFRIRHLRNSWNHDREVKVSRDGTELESIVGQRLIEEWHQLATSEEVPSKKLVGRRSKLGL